MDVATTKKRKTEENGATPTQTLTLEDVQKIISTLTPDDLKSIITSSMIENNPQVLSAVRSIANRDPTQRKLFVRGLGWETTTESLRTIFSQFGDLEEAVVICDKTTGKSKGYGFVTFKNIDGALLALKEPSKKIDGRMSITQLAAAGNSGNVNSSGGNAVGGGGGPAAVGPTGDVSMRKIFVGNVPADMPAERLLSLFSRFGEIEEGPLGIDRQTGKFRGYALFVYRSIDAARAAIAEPMKTVDGYRLVCKFAIDGKKKPGNMNDTQAGGDGNVGPVSGFAGAASGMGSYGFPSSVGHHHMNVNSPLGSSMGLGMSGPPLGSVGSGYGSGPYGGSSQFSGVPSGGGYGGIGMGMGSSLYNRGSDRGPGGMGSVGLGGYSDGGPYGMSSFGHSGPHMGSPPGPRVPPGGGMYQGMPPYY